LQYKHKRVLNLVHNDTKEFEKERYLYDNYTGMLSTNGAKLTLIPPYIQSHFYTNLPPPQAYSPSEMQAYTFMESAKSDSESSDIDDIFKSKLVHSEDNIGLILSQIRDRDTLKYDNLARIYDDLFRVDQFRAEIPYPQKYNKDSTWTDLNNSELKLREQIRRELQTSTHDLSFLSNDLRNSLLEFKLQNKKQSMMDFGGTLDELMEPESSYKSTGETNEYKSNPQEEMA